jgi:hypothetical protein
MSIKTGYDYDRALSARASSDRQDKEIANERKTRADVLESEQWANPFMPYGGYCYGCGYDLVKLTKEAHINTYGNDTMGITGCPSCHRSFVE